ncbi:MAG: 3-isopropylmalate dehydratase small subunit [Rectinemataceae bacterium]|jgi:3-isopropylmalate/(R)-2-methylmalate dehydratase small subunit
MSSEKYLRALVSGQARPLRGDDVDTDRIIPARYMKGVSFEGLGEYAFRDARFDEAGKSKKHPFNDPRFAGASILVVNRNFGCGSSREHAPQALARAGVAALVGESFAEIFAGNCVSLGLPAASVSAEDARELQDMVEADPSLLVELDLEAREIRAGARRFSLSMPESHRKALVTGLWDSTAELLPGTVAARALAAGLPYLAWARAGS